MVAVSIFHPSLFTAARCFNFERLNYHANNVKLFLSNRFFITKREWEGAVYKTRKRRQRPVAVRVRPFFLFLFEEVEVEKKNGERKTPIATALVFSSSSFLASKSVPSVRSLLLLRRRGLGSCALER